MSKKIEIGTRVRVVRDETGEFLNCVGDVDCLEEAWGYENDLSIGVAFGNEFTMRADNTIPLPSGKWGAWFDRGELRKTKQDLSPICPVAL